MLFFLAFAGLWMPSAQATPLYAIRSANRCDTCHIEPTNWENPPKSKRLCTLDCAVCHTSPQGGGLRTPSGQYYGKEVLPRWGERPSSTTDHTQYADEEHPPSKGWYRLLSGFSGWEKGVLPISEIPDRYGDIDPDPKVLVGYDARMMAYDPLQDPDFSIFPMQSEAYVSARFLEHIQAYAAAGLTSDRQTLDATKNPNPPDQGPSALDYLAVRELYVMIDRLPDRTYVRAGRISPIYGWRIADHTAYTRRDLGFDITRQVFGVEAGWNRGYPYVNGSVFAEGVPGWPGDEGNPGKGVSLNAGYRDLGWQAGVSHHQVYRPGYRDVLTGVQWALNLYPVVILGEANHRNRLALGGIKTDALVTYAEVNWEVDYGFNAKFHWEWTDPDVTLDGDHRNRFAIGGEFHPYTHLTVEPTWRTTLINGGSSLSGSRFNSLFTYDARRQQVVHEWMLMGHLWL